MHDWLFLELNFFWQDGICSIKLKDSESQIKHIKCIDVRKLILPRMEPWGESASINGFSGPVKKLGVELLSIEMQSGDCIIIEAKEINMPAINNGKPG
jgi:hypothetical protein